jgi:NADH:ubiquinone oxidoreductase subunit H
MNLVSALVFFGGNSPFSKNVVGLLILITKVVFLIFGFLWVRSSFPRVRYDQLMMLMWKKFLPLSIAFLMFYYFNVFVGGGVAPHYLW